MNVVRRPAWLAIPWEAERGRRNWSAWHEAMTYRMESG
jgi:hypothetical protein